MSALAGIRVLDFTRLLPGPYCTWLLSELGAEVTRVENPREIAKQARVFGWDRLSADQRRRIREQDMLARAKRSVQLDIGHPRAAEVILRLAARADVMVEDYRPGVLDGLGIGATALRRANPALIACSITLCGQTGPYRDRPGHDPLAMAVSGAMSRAGDRPERPSALGLAVADILTGTNAALAVTAALAERTRTGAGRHLDIAMTDTAMCLNANVLSRHPDPATIPPRGRARIDTGIWPTADGGFIATSDMEPRYWERFCTLLDRPDWVARQHDTAAHPEMAEEIAAIFATRSRPAWEALLEAAQTQFAPVLSVSEALADPHNRARGMVVDVPGRDGPVTQLAAPLGPSMRTDAGHRAAVPPGQDTRAVLSELGYSGTEQAALFDAGAVAGAPGQAPPQTDATRPEAAR